MVRRPRLARLEYGMIEILYFFGFFRFFVLGECLAGVCGYIDFFGMIILNFLILKIDMEPVLYQI